MQDESDPSNPHPLDNANALPPDPAQADLALGHEQDGPERLAEHIAVVAETHGPEGVSDYLGDVLADTEGKVPPAERSTAFQLLAGEQRQALRRGLVNAGEEMVTDLTQRNSTAQARTEENSPVTRRVLTDLAEEHRHAVGRHLERGVDTRRASRGQEDLEGAVRKGLRQIADQSETIDGWSRGAQRGIEEFMGQSESGLNHQRALDEAEHITDPSYEGEPKDVSLVIDDAVKAATAAKLHEAVSQAKEEGASSEDAVLRILLEERPDDITAPALAGLRAFASHYDSFARVDTLKVRGEVEEVDHLLRTFARRGRDEYSYVHSVEEAQALYRKQRNLVETAATEAASIGPRTTGILKAEKDELQKLDLLIASAKAKPEMEENPDLTQ